MPPEWMPSTITVMISVDHTLVSDDLPPHQFNATDWSGYSRRQVLDDLRLYRAIAWQTAHLTEKAARLLGSGQFKEFDAHGDDRFVGDKRPSDESMPTDWWPKIEIHARHPVKRTYMTDAPGKIGLGFRYGYERGEPPIERSIDVMLDALRQSMWQAVWFAELGPEAT